MFVLWGTILAQDERSVGDTDNTEAVQPVESSDNNEADTVPLSEEEKELTRKRYQLFLIVMSGLLGSFVILLLLISLVRISRYQRRRLKIGVKSKPTDYVDVWSLHKLPDDPDLENDTDDPEKQDE